MDVRFPPPAETFQLTPKDLDAISEGGADDNDIYRGQPPAPPRPSSPSALSSSSSSSSSSRSSGSVFRGRLGAFHAGVEHAIARWARAWVSSSSLPSSSASSSSKPSIFTVTRSQLARRRRHQSSVASLHNARSEREIAARIRAREKSRYIPRGFVLYTPQPVIVSSTILQPEPEILPHAHPDHVLRTNSLPNLITFLNAVLREGDKARRPRAVPAIPRPSRAATVIPLPHQDYMMPDLVDNEPKAAAPEVRRRGRKGKQRADTAPMSVSSVAMLKTPPSTPSSTSDTAPKAWWLDVSSPTWEDMCAIGKLLHLHPLTLEDILQQDPREKLELFPKLGYYFISFRAIESQKSRERLHPLPSGEEGMSKPTDEGIVGEVNVYLVVFRQGVCSFHFADVAEHVDRVRNKILLLGETVNMSSDWIAHGIMDSIVDSFFPFLEGIEKEVTEIENLVFSVQGGPSPGDDISVTDLRPASSADTAVSHEKSLDEKSSKDTLREKEVSITGRAVPPRMHFALRASYPLLLRRCRRLMRAWIAKVPRLRTSDKRSIAHPPTTMVHRMTRTRRLVTSLTRFLAVKSEVVAQIQKRLLTKGEWGLGTGTEEDLDVFVYMGDVQDHILTLQQALAHYERALSQSHPTYLSQLRLSVSQAKSGTDQAVVILTTVSLAVVCVQTLIGLPSMNVQVPHNDLAGHRFIGFGIVITLAVVVLTIYGSVVRYWWVQARGKRKRYL